MLPAGLNRLDLYGGQDAHYINFYTVTLGEYYIYKEIFTTTSRTVYLYSEDLTLLTTKTIPLTGTISFDDLIAYIGTALNGVQPAINTFIDLKQFSIAVDGVEVFNGNKTGIDQIKKDDYTKVGDVVVSDDGIASGFSSSNYVQITPIDLSQASEWEIKAKFNLSSFIIGSLYMPIFASSAANGVLTMTIDGDGYLAGAIGNSSGDAWLIDETGTWSGSKIKIELNKDYWAKWVFTGNKYILYYSTDGIEYNETISYSTTSKVSYRSSDNFNIGHERRLGGASYFTGSIDLNAFKIYVDGNLVYQPTLRIPYTQSKTGNKIVDNTYRDRVEDMYNQYGYTPYYTLGEDDYTLDTVKPQYAPSILYPSRSAGFKTPQFLVADKQTLTVKGKTSIWLNNGQYMTFLDDQSFTITSLLDTGSSLTAGKDYYVYATTDQKLVVSLDATAPSGYTTYSATKIGGFHTICRTVTASNAPALVTTAGYTSFWDTHPAIGYTAGDAIPISTWTIAHRPYSSPAGMVYVSGDYGEEPFWGDIYLQSGTGSSTASVYGGTITNSRNPIAHQFDMNHVGKKLMTDSQFMIIAEGSNQKTNVSGGAQPSPFTAGGHVDTANQAMISGFFAEECDGLVWQWLDQISPAGGSAWAAYANTERGQSYGMPYVLKAGGAWDNSTNCGSWSRFSANIRSLVSAYSGARGASRCLPWNYFD